MERGLGGGEKTVLSELRAAQDNGVILTIRYHGGSQPGTVRQIHPLRVSADKVRARCVTSNAVKLFRIERIELVDSADVPEGTAWIPPKYDEVEFETLVAVLDHHKTELENLGWTVLPGESEIALHRKFKNGKLLKGSDVLLCFEEERIAECWFDLDGSEHTEWKKRLRPWIIRGKGGEHVGSYKALDRAVTTFLEQARLLSPNGGERRKVRETYRTIRADSRYADFTVYVARAGRPVPVGRCTGCFGQTEQQIEARSCCTRGRVGDREKKAEKNCVEWVANWERLIIEYWKWYHTIHLKKEDVPHVPTGWRFAKECELLRKLKW